MKATNEMIDHIKSLNTVICVRVTAKLKTGIRVQLPRSVFYGVESLIFNESDLCDLVKNQYVYLALLTSAYISDDLKTAHDVATAAFLKRKESEKGL